MPKKKTDLKYYEGIGRRKAATARVRLYLIDKAGTASVGESKLKKGEIIVNQLPIDKVFGREVDKVSYLSPLKLAQAQDRYAVSIKVRGGGKSGQIGAIVLGLSRALQLADAALRLPLKKAGLLTRDARVKERRKVGTGGKARRAKQSPKR